MFNSKEKKLFQRMLANGEYALLDSKVQKAIFVKGFADLPTKKYYEKLLELSTSAKEFGIKFNIDEMLKSVSDKMIKSDIPEDTLSKISEDKSEDELVEVTTANDESESTNTTKKEKSTMTPSTQPVQPVHNSNNTEQVILNNNAINSIGGNNQTQRSHHDEYTFAANDVKGFDVRRFVINDKSSNGNVIIGNGNGFFRPIIRKENDNTSIQHPEYHSIPIINWPEGYENMDANKRSEIINDIVKNGLYTIAGPVPELPYLWPASYSETERFNILTENFKFISANNGKKYVTIVQVDNLRSIFKNPSFRQLLLRNGCAESNLDKIELLEMPRESFNYLNNNPKYDMLFLVRHKDSRKGVLVFINSVPIWNSRIGIWDSEFKVMSMTFDKGKSPFIRKNAM